MNALIQEAAPIRLGDVAPDFTADTTQGRIDFHAWLGKSWGVLFSHPKDFTPVCTTELGALAKLQPEFQRRGVKTLALSVDPLDAHKSWLKDVEETQKCRVTFPLAADPERRIASRYGMIHPNASDTLTVRSVFVIDPQKKVRLTQTYPASTGRGFEELVRVLDALQLADKHSVATPANWKAGGECLIPPALQDPAELRKKFPKGWTQVKPYLRVTPQP